VAKYLRLQVFGGYADSSLAAESWSYNINLGVDDDILANAGTLPSISVSDDFDSGTWASGTWDQTYGAAASTSNLLPGDFLVNQVAPALYDFHRAVTSNGCTLKGAALYPIDAGVAQGGHRAHLYWTTPVAGTLTPGSMCPTQTAAVVSWQANVIGPKGRGRIYVPGQPVSVLTTEGYWATTHQERLRDKGVLLVQDLTFDPVSPTTSKVTPVVCGRSGTNYGRILQVRAGRVPDVQRRRRRQLTENYLVGPVVP